MPVAVEIRGKTEQRVEKVLSVLQKARHPVTYDDLQSRTGAHYDSLLYILATLVEVGLAERLELAEGPGRPRIHFRWVPPEDMGLASG